MKNLYIKAVNPGYPVDGKNNVGEMIEIARKDSDEPISLAGTTVSYTNSSGNESILFEFPENSWMTGESILLRLASSPESELAAGNYTKTLAFKAGLTLSVQGEVIDEVCWTGKNGCNTEFKSAAPTTLVRDTETGEFRHVPSYTPEYDAGAYKVEKDEEIEPVSQCKGLIFSEILSYYESSRSEQFVELYNVGPGQILLYGCGIRYKNKIYGLTGVVREEEYFRYLPIEFSLTKNPTNEGVLEIIDTTGEVVDKLEYPNGQRKGTSYALIGYDTLGAEIWRTTYAPTPGEANHYQEFKTCEEGKVINEATGNCVKVTSVVEKICPAGQYLNILTGRCRKYVETTEKTCKEGYYLNSETGRCRKIQENQGADYEISLDSYKAESSFVALYAVIGVVIVGVVCLVYEFRREIQKLWRKVFRRFR
ncbi:hypothetical protein IKE13_03070 [Candidatus Saccharibacteria bacterium]|nr:hypothetical protein [Candidatus Saccharibacteria bacterium]